MKRRVITAGIAAILLSAVTARAGTQLYPDFGPEFDSWHKDGRVAKIGDSNRHQVALDEPTAGSTEAATGHLQPPVLATNDRAGQDRPPVRKADN